MSRVQTCPGFILLKNLFIKNKAYIQTPTTKHWLPVWRLRDWPNSGKNKQFLLIYSRCWQPLVFHIVSISACLSLILAFYKPLCSLHYIFSLFLSHQPNTPWNQNNHWMPNVNVKCHRKIISCFINGLRITETVQSEALKIQTYPPSFVDFMLCMLAPDTGIIFQSQLELYTFQLSGRRCWYLPIVCLSSPVIYFAQVWPKCN